MVTNTAPSPVAATPSSVTPRQGDGLEAADKWNAAGHIFLMRYAAYGRETQRKGVEATAAAYRQLQDDFGLQRLTAHGTKSADDYLPVFMTFKDETALALAESYGFKTQTKAKTMCTGLLPMSRVEDIANLTGVISLSASFKASLHNDLSRDSSRVTEVQENYAAQGLERAYYGAGVVVGIIDVGFDYTHPFFYGEPGRSTTYRVKRVWDQRASNGTPPQGYDYGAEYRTTADILAAGHDQLNGLNDYHATHVAGTAAGTGAGTAYAGMAPKSDLVFVSTTMMDQGIFDGIAYIEAYARSVGKPCVINMSLGSDIGPHDGTAPIDLAVDELVRDSLILVGSAGNSGATPLHRYFALPAGSDSAIEDRVYFEDGLLVDFWTVNATHFNVKLKAYHPEDGRLLAVKSFSSDVSMEEESWTQDGLNFGQLQAYGGLYEYNGQIELMIALTPDESAEETYTYAIEVSSLQNEAVAAHAWINKGQWLEGDMAYTHNAHLSAGRSVLSVAAYNSRMTWTNIDGESYTYNSIGEPGGICAFSSRGPLVNGVNKPDIAAPGAAILSAGNSFVEISRSEQIMEIDMDGKQYPVAKMQGTSMSAPAVTGMVALLLEHNPGMDIDELKALLSLTARNDEFTGWDAREQPNARWGYGKMDVLAALQQQAVDIVVKIQLQAEGGQEDAGAVPGVGLPVRLACRSQKTVQENWLTTDETGCIRFKAAKGYPFMLQVGGFMQARQGLMKETVVCDSQYVYTLSEKVPVLKKLQAEEVSGNDTATVRLSWQREVQEMTFDWMQPEAVLVGWGAREGGLLTVGIHLTPADMERMGLAEGCVLKSVDFLRPTSTYAGITGASVRMAVLTGAERRDTLFAGGWYGGKQVDDDDGVLYLNQVDVIRDTVGLPVDVQRDLWVRLDCEGEGYPCLMQYNGDSADGMTEMIRRGIGFADLAIMMGNRVDDDGYFRDVFQDGYVYPAVTPVRLNFAQAGVPQTGYAVERAAEDGQGAYGAYGAIGKGQPNDTVFVDRNYAVLREGIYKWRVSTKTRAGKVYALESDPVRKTTPSILPAYTVTIKPAEGGDIEVTCAGETVVSGMDFLAGSVLELRAEPHEGMRFKAWWDGDKAAERSYTLKQDVEIAAKFEAVEDDRPGTGVEKVGQIAYAVTPNPSDGVFMLQLGEAAAAAVYTQGGQPVWRRVCEAAGLYEIDLRALTSGVYYLQLWRDGRRSVEKLVLR